MSMSLKYEPSLGSRMEWPHLVSAGPLNHHDDILDSDQKVVNKELSRSLYLDSARRGVPGHCRSITLLSARCALRAAPYTLNPQHLRRDDGEPLSYLDSAWRGVSLEVQAQQVTLLHRKETSKLHHGSRRSRSHCSRDIDILMPNNQRQHRTVHI